MKGIAKIAAFAAAAAFLAGTALSVSVKTAKADDGEYIHYVLEDDFSEYLNYIYEHGDIDFGE